MLYTEPDWENDHTFRNRYDDTFTARVINLVNGKYLAKKDYIWEVDYPDDEITPKHLFTNEKFWERFEVAPEKEQCEIPKEVAEALAVVFKYFTPYNGDMILG